MRRSTRAEKVLDHLELVGDLRAAQNRHERAVGRRQHAAEVLQLLFHQQPCRGFAHDVRDRFDRGVSAMRGAERVVDVQIGQRRELPGERRVVLFLFRMESQVFQQHDAAARAMRLVHDRLRRGRRCNPVRTTPGGPSSSATFGATGFRLYFGLTCPFGRPRCDARIAVAPLSSAYRIVGTDARMRVSSVTTPFSSGTLKSTRMNTRRPARSRSRIESFMSPPTLRTLATLRTLDSGL